MKSSDTDWKIKAVEHELLKYKVMKKITLGVVLVILLSSLFWIFKSKDSRVFDPKGEQITVAPKPYDKFSFERLQERGGIASNIVIGSKLADAPEYSSYMFTYKSEGRKISGQLNLPNLSRTMAIVVMARGYVEKSEYKTGIGTKNAAAFYAKNGFITIAPDFSGYGESDSEDANALGARLTKPVEILDLLASLRTLPQVDLSKVFLWGHSNGGQIMLSVMEIIGKGEKYGNLSILGATLWAPVSKPFPYNILYYTDEADDQGKWLRSEIAKFEANYDVYKYSIDKYINNIDLPIQVHQGTADDSVPKKWSDELVKNLENNEKIVNYFDYPGADHNFKPGWDTVVIRDLEWFNQLIKEAP